MAARDTAQGRIRIALVLDTIGDNLGGTERQLFLLLDRLCPSRFDPYLLCLYGSDWTVRNRCRYPIHTFGFRSFGQPESYRGMLAMARFLREARIDIVQTHFWDAHIVGVLAARLAGVPVIVDARRNDGYESTAARRIVRAALNRLVTHWLTNSEALKRRLIEDERVAPGRVTVIHNGYPAGICPQRCSGLRGLHGGTAPVTIVSVANLRPVKRHDILLRAARQVAVRHPRVRFLLIGDGPERPRLERQAVAMKLQDTVCFAGYRDDVPELLRSCDIGLLTSESESLSNAIIEYLVAGLPVVCTDAGGNRELVRTGINGTVIPVNDSTALAGALIAMLDRPVHARAMGTASFRLASERFDGDGCVRRHQRFYREVVHFRGRRPR